MKITEIITKKRKTTTAAGVAQLPGRLFDSVIKKVNGRRNKRG